MQFLADHDVYFATVSWLRTLGHDVVTAQELGLQEADDIDLLTKAKALNRLFVSRDKDFGALVFLSAAVAPGVIFLRISPADVEAVHQELQRLLQEQSEATLRVSYCVVERHRYRIRRLPQVEDEAEQ